LEPLAPYRLAMPPTPSSADASPGSTEAVELSNARFPFVPSVVESLDAENNPAESVAYVPESLVE
jgi:hypothetical protein